MGTTVVEIGARVRVVGRTSPAVGRLGTVVLATVAGDGYLVETDEPFAVALGLPSGHVPPVTRRRAWCAAEELDVAGRPAPVSSSCRVRRVDPPSDLGATRRSTRRAAGPAVLEDALAP